MACPRAYRHDVRCSECNRRRQPDASYHHTGPAVKEQVLAMYCEGGRRRAIGRILNVSGQSVSNWVKKVDASYRPEYANAAASARRSRRPDAASGDFLR